uniref:Uncharacterized protein n=1 Tax=Rhizophora mucronata TaxID=61149 RepID=A0A2P2IP90_RHIMU
MELFAFLNPNNVFLNNIEALVLYMHFDMHMGPMSLELF